jgi:hypothetical protein
MAKDKVTSNGEKNQEATGKQEPDVSLIDGFCQIESTAKMLRFLTNVSIGPNMEPDYAFVDTVREMLTQELNSLNEIMKDLAKNYNELTYKQVVVPSV